MEVSSSYTLSSLCECRPSLASNSRPGNLSISIDVSDGHRDHRSPVATAFSFDRHHTRDRAETFDDPGRRDDANDVEANSFPPLT